MTGPRALTFAEATTEIVRARPPGPLHADRPRRFRRQRCGPTRRKDIVQLLHELFTVILDGRNSQVANGVQQALGRPPIDFSDYAQQGDRSRRVERLTIRLS